MKRLDIALILIAAAPAVTNASTNLVNEIAGKNEMASESIPSSMPDDRLISSKSSRPQLNRNLAFAVEPMELNFSANGQ